MTRRGVTNSRLNGITRDPCFAISPEGAGDVNKQRVLGIFQHFLLYLSDFLFSASTFKYCMTPFCFLAYYKCTEAHVFEDSANSVVFSRGLRLTAGQTARMNNCVLTRGPGLGHVFVHTIKVTDVAHNGLVIRHQFPFCLVVINLSFYLFLS